MRPAWLNPENRSLPYKPIYRGMPPHSMGFEAGSSIEDLVRSAPQMVESEFDQNIAQARRKLEELGKVEVHDEGHVPSR